MILACPLCHIRYLISASLFAAGPRQVRCARCTHSWRVELPKEIDVFAMPPADLTPSPESIPPIPEGSNLPALRSPPMSIWLRRGIIGAVGAVGLLCLLVLIFDRQNITKEHPFMEALYGAVGLHIYHIGEGLVIEEVRSELRYEDGIMRLLVQGHIHNTTQKTQQTPALLAKAIGPNEEIMQSWQIDAPTATLAADDVVTFQSSINAPKGTVVEINLNFVESKHDTE